jgi:hypothetical protein
VALNGDIKLPAPWILREIHAGSCCSVSIRSEDALAGMEPKSGMARISMHESGRHARFEHRTPGGAP